MARATCIISALRWLEGEIVACNIYIIVVDTQNWQIARFAKFERTGHVNQSDLGSFVQLPIGLHNCIDLVEMIEMQRQIWSPDKEVMPPERSAPRPDRSETPNLN